jgi:hypothetical protein
MVIRHWQEETSNQPEVGEMRTAQWSGTTIRRVVGILPSKSGLVVVAPDGH